MKKIIGILIVILIAVVGYFIVVELDLTAPTLKNTSISIPLGETDIDDYLEISDNKSSEFKIVIVEGTYDSNTVGVYEITLSIKDEKNNELLTPLTIEVFDNNLNSQNEDHIVVVFAQNIDLAAHLTEHYKIDGFEIVKTEVSHYDTYVVGKQNVTMAVTDINGNVINKNIIFEVIDDIAPSMFARDYTIRTHQAYNPLSYVVAYDNVDGNLSPQISIQNNTVDIEVPGQYVIAYGVIDSSGNESVLEVNVTVSDDAPVTTNNKAYIGSNMMNFLGNSFEVRSGGLETAQEIIDSDKYLIASFGGVVNYSGIDNLHTHFVGHAHGSFYRLWDLVVGDSVLISDADGTVYEYIVMEIVRVDNYAYGLDNNLYYGHYVFSEQGGEVITLQTCVSRTTNQNWFIRAVKTND